MLNKEKTVKRNVSAIVAGIFAGLFFVPPAYAIDLEQIEIFGYGSVLYRNYDYLQNYQKAPKNRSKIDFERFVISPRFLLSDDIKIVSEIEFEHGGTGVTMEYDTLDEFGEFETEVEKGGEVTVEEAYVDIANKEWLNYRVGHMIIPVGLNTQRHLPTLYLATSRNISETTIIPNTWHETGVMAYGQFAKDFHYQATITTGLNSEFFDSSHWIRAGTQRRFEYANADNLAIALRVDYGNIVGSHFGASIYTGDTNDNRNKEQLDSAGTVTITEIHGVYDEGNIRLRALALLGKLSDSEAITVANNGLPNALEAKRSPVASEAMAWFVEAGYDLSPLLGYDKAIIPFARYDFVDSMYDTTGIVQDLDRFERTTVTAGINYFFSPTAVFKADYSRTYNGDDNIDDMDTYTFAIGYQF